LRSRIFASFATVITGMIFTPSFSRRMIGFHFAFSEASRFSFFSTPFGFR